MQENFSEGIFKDNIGVIASHLRPNLNSSATFLCNRFATSILQSEFRMSENIAETNSTESEEILAEDNIGEQQLTKNDDAESCEEDYPLNPESTDLTELIDICLYKVFSKDASRSL
ncbi:MAG: hypothetical protein MHMPM18_003197 [Marteilia pararefringens]